MNELVSSLSITICVRRSFVCHEVICLADTCTMHQVIRECFTRNIITCSTIHWLALLPPPSVTISSPGLPGPSLPLQFCLSGDVFVVREKRQKDITRKEEKYASSLPWWWVQKSTAITATAQHTLSTDVLHSSSNVSFEPHCLHCRAG